MDVVQIPKNEGVYRVLPDEKGRLILHQIKQENVDLNYAKLKTKPLLKMEKLN